MTETTSAPKRRPLKKSDAYLLSAVHDLRDAAGLAYRHLRMEAEGTSNADTESAFLRAMIVCYASPWSMDENPATENVFRLPLSLTRAERNLHGWLIDLRNNRFAHTNRRRSDPAVHVEPNGAKLFSRVQLAIPASEVIGLWHNALKMAGVARGALSQKHSRVFPMQHILVTEVERCVTNRRMQLICREVDDQMVREFVLHKWRESDLVSIDEAAKRLGLHLRSLRSHAADAALNFPDPAPSVRGGSQPTRWRMSDIRAWAIQHGWRWEYGSPAKKARQPD